MANKKDDIEKKTAGSAIAPDKAAELGAEEILAKYDPEFSFRKLKGYWPHIVTAICVIWSIGQLYTAAFGVFPSTLQRAPHVGFALVLIYILYAVSRKRTSDTVPWNDLILIVLSAGVALYHVIFYEDIIYKAGNFDNLDFAVSLVAVLLILEASRRVCGIVITVLAAIFLVYAYVGPELPGFLAHPGFTVKRIVTFQWLSTEGILGIPIDVSSTFIFLFMLFASFLRRSGIGDWMTNVAVGLTGGAVGGPAKAAVIASSLQGTISGSSVANVVGTGSVTIPLMKSIGYRREFAGAVEACASTGGQLMPPIMGAAAFVMTEFLNIPYINIAIAAAIPAVFYFTGVFISVHLEAKKTGLHGIPKEDLPDWRGLLRTRWTLAMPIVAIVAFLTYGFTPMLAALLGLIAIIAVSFLHAETRMSLKDFVQGLEDGARSALPVVVACATAGIIVGIITLSGLGLKMAGGIVALAGGSVYLTLIFTMISSLILGMGVPTTANYIIQSTISAPALIQVGIPPLAAHLFVFYFGIIADITPPVALAAFAASGVAKSAPFRTGIEAFKLGYGAYIVPYVFVMFPSLLFIRFSLPSFVEGLMTTFLGIFAIGACATGYFRRPCRWWERVLLLVAGFSLISPLLQYEIAGVAIMVFLYVRQRTAVKREAGIDA
ncbi:TRAP transporter permease [Anaeroselena agilis]|uniref:TRAP transporter permease n=1 Tax=Anaeroselena agilis TaxID=3063788 RepID=A0ABU3P0H9_9FIRM|nr:TRAP transporter permease [Selenomonadales bacterium 4137-cl]